MPSISCNCNIHDSPTCIHKQMLSWAHRRGALALLFGLSLSCAEHERMSSHTSTTTDANISTKPLRPHRPLRCPNTRSLQVFAVSVVFEASEHATIVFLGLSLSTFFAKYDGWHYHSGMSWLTRFPRPDGPHRISSRRSSSPHGD